MSPSRQVIIGASAAGVSAALAMRRVGFDGDITVVDADHNRPYERPPLSKSLTSSAGEELRPIIPWERYQDEGIELLLGTAAARLDVARHRVVLADGQTLAADHVVLATGVAARRLPIPGADLGNVLVLRDAADARRLASRLDACGGPVVIIGGGFIGLEIASVAREQDIDVTVVEQAPLPLAAVAGQPVARLVRQLHADRGVTFVLGATVTELRGSADVEAAVVSDGTVRPAATVVVGVGVVPRQELAVDAGLAVDSYGVVVDRFGATSESWVSAAGDVASQPHPALAGHGRIEHWDAALKHGAAVGASAAGMPTVFDSVPYAWSDQYGLTYQMFGRPRAGDEFVFRDGATPERFTAFWLRDGRLASVMGLDVAREVAAARRLIESGLPVPRAQLADADVDLRRLSRPQSRPATRDAAVALTGSAAHAWIDSRR